MNTHLKPEQLGNEPATRGAAVDCSQTLRQTCRAARSMQDASKGRLHIIRPVCRMIVSIIKGSTWLICRYNVGHVI